ncbi:MAG: MipA/OmpV family protein [Gammaproteobacteria bacterium]|nr:MipA/OmpV family protein [Gammaproteobacteria bacterium]
MRKTLLNILFLLTALYSSQSGAQDIIWDLGAGAATFNLSLYPGSADKINYTVPMPYFTLLAEKLEIDRSIRTFLFKTKYVALDLSLGLGIPVDSEDSGAREGMPDLDAIAQLGPSLEFILVKPAKDRMSLHFELPLRAAVATDFKSSSHEGWLLEPQFSLEKRRLYKSGLAMKLTLGVNYATRDFHAYYYEVASSFATSSRPAYISEKGYGGAFANLSASWREGNLIWWTLLQYRNLNGAVFEDSPLVEQKHSYLIGVGFAWVFAQNL